MAALARLLDVRAAVSNQFIDANTDPPSGHRSNCVAERGPSGRKLDRELEARIGETEAIVALPKVQMPAAIA